MTVPSELASRVSARAMRLELGRVGLACELAWCAFGVGLYSQATH